MKLRVTVSLIGSDEVPIGHVSQHREVDPKGDVAGPATEMTGAIVGGMLFGIVRKKGEAHELTVGKPADKMVDSAD